MDRFVGVLLRAILLFIATSLLFVTALRWIDPPTTAFMLQARFASNTTGGKAQPIRYRWVDFDEISPHLALAYVAAEDQKFPHHSGFDFAAIRDALTHNRENRRLRGASTITQQVAKNLFLWSGRNYLRKGLEAYFTFLLESIWPKRRILEVYLNIAQLGDRLFGVGAASQVYLKQPASQVERAHAALFAAVLPNPRRYQVLAPSAYVRERQRWILRQMSALGGHGYLDSI